MSDLPISLVRVEGPDRLQFLQSQLTNDVLKLPKHKAQWQGYCTAKGRLLASLLVWQDDDAVYLQVASDLVDGLVKRLRMYVLRAKVTFTVLSPIWQVVMRRLEVVDQTIESDALLFVESTPHKMMITFNKTHQLIWFEVAAHPELVAQANPLLLTEMWQGALVQACIPHITLATQEHYVPQMVNWDLIGGVSFHKGCYPGQEIVARSHYLGKLKRRMGRAFIKLTVPDLEPQAAQDIVLSSGDIVGTLVNVVKKEPQLFDALFEAPTDYWYGQETAPLFWRVLKDDQPYLVELDVLPMPYSLNNEQQN